METPLEVLPLTVSLITDTTCGKNDNGLRSATKLTARSKFLCSVINSISGLIY